MAVRSARPAHEPREECPSENTVQSVGDAFINLLAQILSAIPAILAFLLIVLVGYLVAKALRTATARLLDRFGFDRALQENEYGQ